MPKAKRKSRRGGLRPGAGRPRGAYSRKRRCPCGKNTIKRARARSFDCCKNAGIVDRIAGKNGWKIALL